MAPLPPTIVTAQPLNNSTQPPNDAPASISSLLAGQVREALPPALPPPAPSVTAQPLNNAAQPLNNAAQPLNDAPAPLSSLFARQVREALPPALPPPAPSVAELAASTRVKSIRQISLDISLPVEADPMLNQMAPPTNYAAEALPRMAEESPFYRGDLIDYGMYDNTPLPPVSLDMCYQPLYFEELNAERYGRSWGCLQPAVSMASFYGRIPLLPYMAFARPARRCTYHAHWALPGYRIPGREPNPPVVSAAGGAAQTAAMIGVILLIP